MKEPQSESYLRVKEYITRLHQAGKYDILRSINKDAFIETILHKKGFTIMNQAAIHEAIALDRYRRLVFQHNPTLSVDSQEDTQKLQQYALEELGYRTPQIESESQKAINPQPSHENAVQLNSRAHTKPYDMNRARSIMEQAKAGKWPKEMESPRQEEQIEITQELFSIK